MHAQDPGVSSPAQAPKTNPCSRARLARKDSSDMLISEESSSSSSESSDGEEPERKKEKAYRYKPEDPQNGVVDWAKSILPPRVAEIVVPPKSSTMTSKKKDKSTKK